MPVSLPSSTTKLFGAWLTTISTFSSSASSSSHSEALKKPRGLRAITFTSFAPSRSEVRQQSIAVLPTPMISTLLADRLDVIERHRLEPVDADVNVLLDGGRGAAAGQVEVLAFRRAAADEDCVELSRCEQLLHARHR